MNALKAYLEDVAKEMRKVNWPKQQELISNTGITLVGTLLFGLFVFATDRVISVILDLIYV